MSLYSISRDGPVFKKYVQLDHCYLKGVAGHNPSTSKMGSELFVDRAAIMHNFAAHHWFSHFWFVPVIWTIVIVMWVLAYKKRREWMAKTFELQQKSLDLQTETNTLLKELIAKQHGGGSA